MATKNIRGGLPVRFSAVEKYPHIIFPAELNGDDEAFGGQIFSIMDRLAGTVFRLHAAMRGVTAGFDEGVFIAGVKQGDLIILRSAINRVWNTSCEIGVKAFLVRQENNAFSLIPVTRVYLSYVCNEFDETGKRKPIPPVIPESPDELRRYRAAAQRRRIRLLRKKRNAQKPRE